MRARGRSVVLAVLLVAASVAAQTRHQHGPTSASRGPAIAGSGSASSGGPGGGGGTTTFILPAAGPADANCPASIPTVNSYVSGQHQQIDAIQTCTTGLNAGGYDVITISMWIQNALVSKHLACSVYDSASPKNHLAAGCDVTATTTANPAAFITMSTPGSCHLNPSTRYWIACNGDDGTTQYGQNNTACASCLSAVLQAYGTWPATLGAGGTSNVTPAFYLTVR